MRYHKGEREGHRGGSLMRSQILSQGKSAKYNVAERWGTQGIKHPPPECSFGVDWLADWLSFRG